MPEKLKNPVEETLGKEEIALLEEVSRFIQSGIPADFETQQLNMYISKNLKHQDEISSLKAAVVHTSNILFNDLRKKEALERESLLDEGYKSSHERGNMLYRDRSIADLQKRYNTLVTIKERLSSLEWQLTHMFKAMVNTYEKPKQ